VTLPDNPTAREVLVAGLGAEHELHTPVSRDTSTAKDRVVLVCNCGASVRLSASSPAVMRVIRHATRFVPERQ
jgi:hypothetical protein